jgi:hypothetical protein
VVQVGEHTLPLHNVLPWAFVQAFPQAPQFVVEVCVFVSHPLFGLPSQLENPVVQVGTHTPVVHTVVPLPLVHAVAQAPQLVVVFSGVSHPLPTFESQLPNPRLQAIEHVLFAQVGVPLFVEHAAPQLPQCATVFCVFVSQPFSAIPSQLPNPVSHDTIAQAPVVQVSVAFGRAHAEAHAPQLVSVVRGDSQPF